jgi:hypothetical protein
MTTRKRSPSAPSVTGPAAIADLRLPGRCASAPSTGPPWRSAARTAGPGEDQRPYARPATSRKPGRRLRTPPPPRDPRPTRRPATWRSSCAGQRRTALTPTARTPGRPVRHPAMPSPAQEHIEPPARSWYRLAASPACSTRREQHTETGAIESQCVRLSANSARPARRSNDGQAILDALSAAWELGLDLRFRRAPLRNRTVDLLLTMNPRQVPSPQVGCIDLAEHERTRALTSSR